MGTLRLLAAQQILAHHEEIGERAGDEEAMSVLLEPAIAQLSKAEHLLETLARSSRCRVASAFGSQDSRVTQTAIIAVA